MLLRIVEVAIVSYASLCCCRKIALATSDFIASREKTLLNP